jgi:hypothetical protein
LKTGEFFSSLRAPFQRRTKMMRTRSGLKREHCIPAAAIHQYVVYPHPFRDQLNALIRAQCGFILPDNAERCASKVWVLKGLQGFDILVTDVFCFQPEKRTSPVSPVRGIMYPPGFLKIRSDYSFSLFRIQEKNRYQKNHV